MPNDKKLSDLAAAAAALDAQLLRYENVANEARRTPLTSEKNINRAARALNDAATAQDGVSECLGSLVQAIAAARERQEANMKALLAHAHEVQARAKLLEELLVRFAALGAEAKTVNALVQEMGAPKPTPADVAQIDAIEARMAGIVDGAELLLRAADDADLNDISRQAHSLRQQVLSVRNKLVLVRNTLAEGARSN